MRRRCLAERASAGPVAGPHPDPQCRPFFAHGGKISIREFLVGAFNDEMGLQSVDPEMMQAHNGARITTPSGMVLDGTQDQIEAPPTDSETADPDHDGVAASSSRYCSITRTILSRRIVS